MVERATACPALRHGQPGWQLDLPGGDGLWVALQGAQVLSWVAGGRERLYLSPRSPFDGKTAIRGGIPVCFPQFNLRGPLPKHGFARNLPWQPDAPPVLGAQEARLSLRLAASAATRTFWPPAFDARLTLLLEPGQLQITLEVNNTDAEPLSFTGALHTYLAVEDIAAVRLSGLAGQPEWDAVADRHGHAADALRFHDEFDRVYAAAARPLILQEPQGRLRIEQSPSFANTVVWNPGPDKCRTLADMPEQGYRQMLCVEAAQVMQPITLASGAHWQGWQRLSVS